MSFKNNTPRHQNMDFIWEKDTPFDQSSFGVEWKSDKWKHVTELFELIKTWPCERVQFLLGTDGKVRVNILTWKLQDTNDAYKQVNDFKKQRMITIRDGGVPITLQEEQMVHYWQKRDKLMKYCGCCAIYTGDNLNDHTFAIFKDVSDAIDYYRDGYKGNLIMWIGYEINPPIDV